MCPDGDVAAGDRERSAQQGTTEVRGRVADPQGAILPGVNITVRNQDTGMFRETVSTEDGSYFVSGIVPGKYQIVAECRASRRYNRTDLGLEVGKTTTLDIQLAVGGLEETVTVSAESPIVDTTSKEVGGRVTARELVELPSVNRNFVGFVGLLPGVIPSISTESFGSDSVTVNGQDPRNNNYMLDGANNNDDVIGQRAGTQARTPIEAVQEFQVLTNQFDAEFGRTTGAVINAVTKQGTNAFRGSLFGFFQDASHDRRDLLREEADRQPDEAEHVAAAMGRHDRRSGHPQQGSFLRQPRARDHRLGHQCHHTGAARSQRIDRHGDPGLEHDRPVRSPDHAQ